MTPLVGAGAGARALESPQHATHPSAMPESVVDKVREATAPFTDVQIAMNAEYGKFLGCVSGPDHGAMGVHFVNETFLKDGIVNVNQPEALIYEPRNGGLRLVGVGYIVPVETWDKDEPPMLEDQVFQFVDTPNRFNIGAFYELHVWARQENPHGTFADWNMNVSSERQ